MEKKGHHDNGLVRFFRIGQSGDPVHESADRRRAGQDVSRHHDQAHLHRELEQAPEALTPGQDRLVGRVPNSTSGLNPQIRAKT